MHLNILSKKIINRISDKGQSGANLRGQQPLERNLFLGGGFSDKKVLISGPMGLTQLHPCTSWSTNYLEIVQVSFLVTLIR